MIYGHYAGSNRFSLNTNRISISAGSNRLSLNTNRISILVESGKPTIFKPFCCPFFFHHTNTQTQNVNQTNIY
ncbi:hypothetical protein V6Z11_D13G267600 [Gossypium hirsutum]